LFSVGDVANVASTFSGAIDLILEKAQSKVADLDLFNSRDREQIWDWNRNEPTTVPGCVHEYVHRQVLIAPEKQAVCSWDGDFTYFELHRLSNKLAYYLCQIGVGPEILVPHCFDKSKWSTVCTLAIMKAGGGSVGLSPTHPVDRLQAIVESCRSKVVVAAHQHVQMFRGIVDKVIDFTPEFITGLPNVPAGFAFPRVAAHNTAFVSFTSGSTGVPKGIVLQHDSLISSIHAHGNQWNVGSESRVIQYSAYAFDASMSDTYTTLCLGGTVCIPSENDRLNDLAGAINRLGVNWAFLTPRLIGTLSPRSVPGLKYIVLGGEAIKPEDIDPWINEVALRLVYGLAFSYLNCFCHLAYCSEPTR
jgi:non-ribosomal peptide synthetase component F